MKVFPRGLLRGVCALILSMGLCLNAAAKENTTPLSLSPLSLEKYPLYQQEERAAERVEELSRTYRLSPREQEVLALLAEGKTGRVIQQELFIAEGTFKAHTRHIYEKMGINSRKELFELLGLRS